MVAYLPTGTARAHFCEDTLEGMAYLLMTKEGAVELAQWTQKRSHERQSGGLSPVLPEEWRNAFGRDES